MELVSVHDVKKIYGKVAAVNGINFDINKGSCTALLGPNGAGKTTTLKLLAGLIKPTAGSITFTELKETTDYRQIIGYLPQHPVFYNWMTAFEFLVYVGQLGHLTKKDAKQKADELLGLVGIKNAKNRRIGGFSGGMKQRLGIAQAMIHNPKLLMLDEPVSSLDPIGRREILELLQSLKKETTILFSTHVLHDAEEICEDIIIIQKGEIALTGSLEDLRKQNQQDFIEIMIEDTDMEEWVQSLQQLDVVKKVVIEKKKVTIHVNDLQSARIILLSEITTKKIPINSFRLGHTSLEDVFMKVVMS